MKVITSKTKLLEEEQLETKRDKNIYFKDGDTVTLELQLF